MSPRSTAILLWPAAGLLAFFIQTQVTEAEVRTAEPADPLSRFIGSAKEAFGDTLFLKADAYFHGGVADNDRDMESEEEIGKEGVIAEDREGPKTANLWADHFSDEKALYEKALSAFARKPDAPLYHYGPTVPAQLARMEARYGTGERGLRILHQLADVAPWLKRAVALPVSDYGLASVARATGYGGRDPARETLMDVFGLEAGESGARERLIEAADAEREALRHVLGWLRSDA